jgi:hypothetical protein
MDWYVSLRRNFATEHQYAKRFPSYLESPCDCKAPENESSEAIQRGNASGEAEWAGKTGSATVQNCQNYQYYHCERASAICAIEFDTVEREV